MVNNQSFRDFFPRSHNVINFEQEWGEIENFSSGIGVFHIIMLKFELFAALLFERHWQTNVPKGKKKSVEPLPLPLINLCHFGQCFQVIS